MSSNCYFCAERPRVSYFSYWCDECALLRRILLVYSPVECISILKRTCLRDEKQIDYKISQEIKKIIKPDIPPVPPVVDDNGMGDSTYATKTRSKSNKI